MIPPMHTGWYYNKQNEKRVGIPLGKREEPHSICERTKTWQGMQRVRNKELKLNQQTTSQVLRQ